jgi:hypothetical protein
LEIVEMKSASTSCLAGAVKASNKGLSWGHPVLSQYKYFDCYKPALLPSVKDRRNIHKTFILDKKKNLNVNFALRAATQALILEESKKTGFELVFITIHLNDELSQNLSNDLKDKKPTQYFNELLRKRVLKRFEVDDYYFVIEKVGTTRLHAHIVCLIKIGTELLIRDAFRASGWLLLNKANKVSNGVSISRGYYLRMLRRSLGEVELDLLDMEVTDYAEESFWKSYQTIPDVLGETHDAGFKTKEPVPIDVGLADYLSKQLNEKIFGVGGGKNYSISQSLSKLMNPLIDHLISEGRKS